MLAMQHLVRRAQLPAASRRAQTVHRLKSVQNERAAAVIKQDFQVCSLLLLMHESLRRAFGRSLVSVDDLMQVDAAYSDLKCCILAFGPGQKGPDELLYTNHAAAKALGSGQWLHKTSSQQLINAPEKVPLNKATDKVPAAHKLPGAAIRTESGTAVTTDLLSCVISSPNGSVIGTAYLFDAWVTSDGRHGRPLLEPLPLAQVPTASDIQACQDRVRQQADHVRQLKSNRGLSNKLFHGKDLMMGLLCIAGQDPEVVAAVSTLQGLKAELQVKDDAKSAFEADASLVRKLLTPV